MTTFGIDLGTTNTVIAIGDDVLQLPDEGSSVLPSVVAYPPNGATLVGTRARRRRALDAANTIVSAKRVIGRRWGSGVARVFAERYPFELVDADGSVGFKTRGGVITPSAVGAEVLRYATELAPVPVEEAQAVIAVPSEFDEAQRAATKRAGEMAGFTDVTVIDEPVATALAYVGRDTAGLSRAVVFDLGGGTFDVAVLDMSGDVPSVVCQGGDLYLGGDDVDRSLAEWAAGEVLREHRWDLRDDARVFDRLIVECERAKVRLSYAAATRIELAQVDPGAMVAQFSVPLDRERVGALTSDLVRRTFAICDDVLHRARVAPNAVDAVFLAGGSTQLPTVRSAVATYFARPPRCELDPMEVVALGAAR